MVHYKLGVELWIIMSNEYIYGSSNWTTAGYTINLSAQIRSGRVLQYKLLSWTRI